jgi:hypothetical protein
MSTALLPIERFELKYLIDEAAASKVRRQIAPYCRPDVHATTDTGAPVRSYAIRSLYLDTPSLAFHRAKEQGASERHKLRIRGYADGRAALEIKQRSRDTVSKRRVFVDRTALREAALGGLAPETLGPQERDFLDHFAWRVLSTGAEPKLLVAYDREAWSSRVDHYARVTFDRNVRFQQTDDWSLEPPRERWERLEEFMVADAPRPAVILELKCENAVPHWLLDVIRRNALRRQSVSKYSLGIYLSRRLDGHAPTGERARGFFR